MIFDGEFREPILLSWPYRNIVTPYNHSILFTENEKVWNAMEMAKGGIWMESLNRKGGIACCRMVSDKAPIEIVMLYKLISRAPYYRHWIPVGLSICAQPPHHPLSGTLTLLVFSRNKCNSTIALSAQQPAAVIPLLLFHFILFTLVLFLFALVNGNNSMNKSS